jgi:hypothetical protein
MTAGKMHLSAQSPSRAIDLSLSEKTGSAQFPSEHDHTPDALLSRITKLVCQKRRIDLPRLTGIQRKFLTHYRCGECGLLPLYYVDLLHIKRVRCGKCGRLIAFKRRGKYGKARKDIAVEIRKFNQGGLYL